VVGFWLLREFLYNLFRVGLCVGLEDVKSALFLSNGTGVTPMLALLRANAELAAAQSSSSSSSSRAPVRIAFVHAHRSAALTPTRAIDAAVAFAPPLVLNRCVLPPTRIDAAMLAVATSRFVFLFASFSNDCRLQELLGTQCLNVAENGPFKVYICGTDEFCESMTELLSKMGHMKDKIFMF
jgi:ferredoxin-NADP reductase